MPSFIFCSKTLSCSNILSRSFWLRSITDIRLCTLAFSSCTTFNDFRRAMRGSIVPAMASHLSSLTRDSFIASSSVQASFCLPTFNLDFCKVSKSDCNILTFRDRAESDFSSIKSMRFLILSSKDMIEFTFVLEPANFWYCCMASSRVPLFRAFNPNILSILVILCSSCACLTCEMLIPITVFEVCEITAAFTPLVLFAVELQILCSSSTFSFVPLVASDDKLFLKLASRLLRVCCNSCTPRARFSYA
mmetsp:Transcript_21016/g.25510  ORF Transcript_21016/g.25510 Transcript_21016/m.25510 type:complete len:248 (+) Transcript_21016:1288-2031(+)